MLLPITKYMEDSTFNLQNPLVCTDPKKNKQHSDALNRISVHFALTCEFRSCVRCRAPNL